MYPFYDPTKAVTSLLRFLLWQKTTYLGLDNIQPSQTYLILANHQSDADPMLITRSFPGVVRYMAKKELFNIVLFGHYFRLAGCFPVIRNDPDSVEQAMRQAALFLKNGETVGVFPQGTKQKNPFIKAISDKVAKTARESGRMILPVGIVYAGDKSAWYCPGQRAAVSYGQPTAAEGLSRRRLIGLINNEVSRARDAL